MNVSKKEKQVALPLPSARILLKTDREISLEGNMIALPPDSGAVLA